jgi:hypothetical protein
MGRERSRWWSAWAEVDDEGDAGGKSFAEPNVSCPTFNKPETEFT